MSFKTCRVRSFQKTLSTIELIVENYEVKQYVDVWNKKNLEALENRSGLYDVGEDGWIVGAWSWKPLS